jgi:hypothetical protein
MYAMAIFGIVLFSIIILTVFAAVVMLFPDFVRYMKMRSL